jgi:lon-related putative ATP-dependent protease
MKGVNPLDPTFLSNKCDYNKFKFKDTNEIDATVDFIGQKRALNAIQFGIQIKHDGYNFYALGPNNLGKQTIISTVLQEEALKRPTPPDFCYVFNFKNPRYPVLLQLPPGMGRRLRRDMEKLIENLISTLSATFETEEYQARMKQINEEVSLKQKEYQEKIYEEESILHILNPLIKKIRKKYNKFPQVLAYLDDLQEDIISNSKTFSKMDEQPISKMWGESHPSEFAFSRYQINVIIDNSNMIGAPVIYEDNPRYYNLIGRIEHVSQLGALVTDFTFIRRGALHRANGGYLILEAERIITQDWTWEALKRGLLEKKIKIELPPHLISVTSTSTLEPEPIPLDIKIVLLGNRSDYYHLRDTDIEFNHLFKVAVDFEETITRDEGSLDLYAKFIATQARKKKLRPFKSTAVARIIDYSSRRIQDSKKISLDIDSLNNLLEESDHWANEAGHELVTRKDVQYAIDCQMNRLDHYQQLMYEEIQRNILFISTQGKEISQINALTTFRFGDFIFGFPSRITATARVGREGIINIEREADLSGPIHSKGVLILSGFLRGHYAPKFPLTLSASIVFEQSYTSIDGDSASVAELCSLLSALSDVPIKQALAVTGSINQLGFVQPIDHVNEKIEGFFDICKLQKLTGEQGVLIPKSNTSNLILREDVVKAVQDKKFYIYPIETIDQAILLLMDTPAGERDKKGNYPDKSINFLVEQKLKEFAKINKKWSKDGT